MKKKTISNKWENRNLMVVKTNNMMILQVIDTGWQNKQHDDATSYKYR